MQLIVPRANSGLSMLEASREFSANQAAASAIGDTISSIGGAIIDYDYK